MPPTETYVIAHPNLLIEADRKLPIRPARLILEKTLDTETINAASELFGETVSEGLKLAPHLGILMVRYTPSYKNIVSFASLQAKEKFTLPYIRRGNEAQVSAIMKYLRTRKYS